MKKNICVLMCFLFIQLGYTQELPLHFNIIQTAHWNSDKTVITVDSTSLIKCNTSIQFFADNSILLELIYFNNNKKKSYKLKWNKKEKHFVEGGKVYYMEYSCSKNNDGYEYILDIHMSMKNNQILGASFANPKTDEILMFLTK